TQPATVTVSPTCSRRLATGTRIIASPPVGPRLHGSVDAVLVSLGNAGRLGNGITAACLATGARWIMLDNTVGGEMSEMLPLFPPTGVLFPGMRLPLHIFEQRYRQLVADLLEQPEPRQFGVIAIRKGRETGVDGVTALYDVGCIATVRKVEPREDGRFDLLTV